MNRLGIDIGRVIIDGSSGSGDTSFFSGDTAAMLRTPAVPGAFAAIARLVPLFEEAWLVSKCGPRVQRRSVEWLRHHRFFEVTGIAEGDGPGAALLVTEHINRARRYMALTD